MVSVLVFRTNFKRVPQKMVSVPVFRTNFKRLPQKIVSVPVFRTNFKVQKGNTENGLSTGTVKS